MWKIWKISQQKEIRATHPNDSYIQTLYKTKQNQQKHALIPDGNDTIKTSFLKWGRTKSKFLFLEKERPQCNIGAKTKKKSVDQKKKVKSLALFMTVNLWQSSRTSAGAPLDASERGTLITVLGTKNAGKNKISEYLFFFFFIHILFINNTSFTFVFVSVCVCVCVCGCCIKDSKMKRESRSDRTKTEVVWMVYKKQQQDAERQRSGAMKSAKMELTGGDNETQTNRVMMRDKMEGFWWAAWIPGCIPQMEHEFLYRPNLERFLSSICSHV